MTTRIILVCSGNICRSPLAAVMTKRMAEERGASVAVISAGTLHLNGEPAAKHSITVATEYGLDLSSHRSQGLSLGFIDLADALVVMSPKHERYIVEKAPAAAAKVVRLWEFSDRPLDEIADPVGQSIDAFRIAGRTIETCLNNWFESVIRK